MKYLYWITAVMLLVSAIHSISEYLADQESQVSLVESAIAAEQSRHQELLNMDLSEFGLPDVDRTVYSGITVLVYEQGRLINWSDNAFVPPLSRLQTVAGTSVVEDNGGHYLVTFRDRPEGLSFAISNLLRTYPFANDYLGVYNNPEIFDAVDGEVTASEGEPITLDGKVICYFRSQQQEEPGLSNRSLLLIWLTFALLAISVFAYVAIRFFPDRWYPWLVAAWGFVLKAVSVYLPQPTGMASYRPDSFWHLSLWDVFVSVALFLTCMDLIFNYLSYTRPAKKILRRANKYPLFFAVSICILSLLSHYLYLVFLREFLYVFPVSLDISAGILFDTPRVLGFAIFLLSSVAFLSIIHYLSGIFAKLRVERWPLFLIIAITSILFVALPIQNKFYIIVPHTVIWGIIYQYDLSKNLIRLSYITFFYIIVIIALASFTAATAIYKDFERKEVARKQSFATQMLTPRDATAEWNLNKVRENIQADATIRTRFLSDRLSKEEVRIKIDRQYLTSYFDRYEATVSFFDKNLKQLEGEDLGNAGDFLAAAEESATEYPGLYFIENWENLGRSKYIVWIPMGPPDELLGGIIIELMLKKLIPNSVYPALLSEEPERNEDFDFALFREGSLIYSKGDYSFDVFSSPQRWQRLLKSEEGIEVGGYHLLARMEDSAIMVVVSPVYPQRAQLANLCFQFLILLCFVGISLFILRSIFPTRALNLANRIQLYLGISFVLPLLIVSAVILNLLNSSYRDEIIRNYQKRAITVSDNIYRDLALFEQNIINRSDLFVKIGDASRFTQSDLNLYNVNGSLTVTSQPDIYTNQLVSRRINPLGFLAIEEDPEKAIVLEESVGKLNFKSVYQGVVDRHNGTLLGIISMPFFDSKNHLNRQQIEVFGNLVMVFTIIFLSSVVIGYLVLRNITKPITTLSARLRQTNFEHQNEPIQYKGGDEIGQLVDEYNRMLMKLEASKEALAQSQKETAWKEIARQVAHEIKNPLTPMRLKIQQLMRNMKSEEMGYNVLGSLISQIDTLSEIADSFSAFAKMPAPNNEIVGFSELTTEVCSLYSTEDVAISCDIDQGLNVYADPNILGRVLNNLVINGIQAVKDRKAHLQVGLTRNRGKVILKVTDNGLGIPEELRHKVFTPYFSTKEKGSGIGLAIAKKGIEQAGGSIWFDTEEGKGTTFTVILPEAGTPYR
ncbi:MAG: HAMP domain-containing sensor histidine kinase [Bacteroidota bacterium]